MARIEEVQDSPKPDARKKRGQSPLLKYYLVAYNFANALGWSYVLICTLIHIFAADSKGGQLHILAKSIPFFPAATSSSSRFSATGWVDRPSSSLPSWAQYVEKHVLPKDWTPLLKRTTTTFERVGLQTSVVQTFAIMEVVHSLLGWVRSPLVTVLMQVASRYYAVYGVSYLFLETRTNPLYTTMILSWSITEVIRYIYYAFNLLGYEPYALLWTRYTTFYLLYPTGASSEAFLIFASLPNPKDKPLIAWGFHDWLRLALFCIWWPSLYVLFTHMMKQRRKVLGFMGPGKTLGSKPKSQ